jgi:integrase/recombinase XerD
MQGIRSMRVTSPLADLLTEEELQTLLATASKDSRNYFLFLLFIKTGITLEELRRLKLEDFHFDNRFAPKVHIKYVAEKEHKDRFLPLSQETKAVFDEYMTTYPTTNLLFPYSPRGIRFIMAQVVQAAGMKKRVSPQILRDSFAVLCLKQGERLEDVLEKLGLKPVVDDDAGKKYTKYLA